MTDFRLRLYIYYFKNIKVSPHPVSEQDYIEGCLHQQTAKLGTLTTEAESAIALLKERRAALISTAVTGKIDVRDAVDTEEVAA